MKTEAFRTAAMPYGVNAADSLVNYHKANGGISRYEKFRYFLREIVRPEIVGPNLQALLAEYGAAVQDGLMRCEIADGLYDLRAATPGVRWLVVSGGDQDELRDIFARRRIEHLFDGGIFGSPDAKTDILVREIRARNILKPALFLGDSRYDHEAAATAGLDFMFVADWSEFSGWPNYLKREGLRNVGSLRNFEMELTNGYDFHAKIT